MSRFKETMVIAVGGSLLVPEQIDVDFLHHLKTLVAHFTEHGYQLALVIGGGKTSRTYHQAASSFESITNEDLDWIGIKALLLNAELVMRSFKDLHVYPEVILDGTIIPQDTEHPVIIVGAHEPGHSSDYNAVTVAEHLGATRVINFSNIDYIYTEDPRTNPKATPLKELTWEAYRTMIPETWTSNMSAPFDPIASQKAQSKNMTVAVLGPSIDNLTAYLEGNSFEGTLITP